MNTKISLTILFFTTAIFSFGQTGAKRQKAIDESTKNQSVEIINDTAFYIGKPVFLFLASPGSLGMVKQVKSFSGKNTIQITNRTISLFGPKVFYLDFGGIIDKAQLSEKNFSTLLKAMMEAKVFTDKGEVNKDGATKFVAQYKYVAPPAAEYSGNSSSNNTSSGNSSSGYSSYNNQPKTTSNNSNSSNTPPASNSVSFSLKNNSSNNVRVFIGTKPKYGSGTTSSISGNSINSLHGSVGDQLCIVDGSDNPISCMTISSGMGKVYINSAGTGFGDN